MSLGYWLPLNIIYKVDSTAHVPKSKIYPLRQFDFTPRLDHKNFVVVFQLGLFTPPKIDPKGRPSTPSIQLVHRLVGGFIPVSFHSCRYASARNSVSAFFRFWVCFYVCKDSGSHSINSAIPACASFLCHITRGRHRYSLHWSPSPRIATQLGTLDDNGDINWSPNSTAP